MEPPMLVLLIFAVGCLSALLTLLLRRYALRARLLDVPNARSSHSVPTPRGGGLAVVVAFSLGLLVLALTGQIGLPLLMALAGGLAIATVGFVDDTAHVSVRVRLLVHALAALWSLWWLGGFPPLPVLEYQLSLGWLGWPVGLLLMVWLLNLYNFMDGVDGIAGVEAVTVAAGAGLLLLLAAEGAAAPLWLLVTATLGFLVWNWPPAKIFMGDVGSGYLGFVLAVFALAGAHGYLNLWAWLILLGVFLVDATCTLCRRWLAGAKVYEAHRSHAYQWAARRCGSHRTVTLVVAVINVGWLWPLAWVAFSWPGYGLLALLLAYLPLVWLALRLGAGRPEISHA